MKKMVIGILAHVDAGKTTLAESMLYLTGSIRKLGRVDHKDAFLDTYELERARGITIFSKQAVFTYNDMEITLLDTPGHVDFSAEMERTLQVLDYAILVVSGSDGVQGHTETLWRLLARYRIPTFLFVNKMDMNGTDRNILINQLKKRLQDGCMDFMEDINSKEFMENLAMSDEALLEKYIETGLIETQDINALISERKIFPCYFGSALKLEGIHDFLGGLEQFTKNPKYSNDFGAKVYKIARDEQGNRLTYMKITGGSLKVKMLLTNLKEKQKAQNFQRMDDNDNIDKNKEMIFRNSNGLATEETAVWEEKVDQIRIYSGNKYETVDEVKAGAVCAVTGLSKTYPGEGLGIESVSDMPILEPVLNYQIILPPNSNPHNILTKLRHLEEEDPQLHIVWSEQLKEIHVQLMGEVQIEVLKSVILERFGYNIEFGPGNIVYKETIEEPVVGVGHFEPLRHYAEVHLLLEPEESGSGLTFVSHCSEDMLDRNWQRLILTHLEEKEHVGVLTGSPITDMRITLIAGRAHLKHTEGGDFRQATYRAVRQGLKRAKNVLLEPYYNFKLEIPFETVGRAMSDIQRMSGSFQPPETDGEISVLTGYAPVATMRGYQSELADYTGGRGRLFCTLKGYLPCHNTEEVIEALGYDSERDINNPTGSIFCSHGTGFVVEWDKVKDYMHIENQWQQSETKVMNYESVSPPVNSSTYSRGSLQEDKELEEIFIRTFGPIKQKLSYSQNRFGYEKKVSLEKDQIKQQTNSKEQEPNKEPMDEYLLVDGYNIIFSWEELNKLAKVNMDAARTKLMDILCNYQGFKRCIVILVFDAYKVKGGVGAVLDYHNIHVVYTKEAETADEYIEKVTHEISRKHHVTVATSDALEQLIIMGKGAVRISANDLKDEIIRTRDQIRRDYLDRLPTGRAYLRDQFSDNIWDLLEEDSTMDEI
ncbi:TetM/TetW/TetO/TetS family tetracycline resistance ribosomal protection protein [Mobilitalea sibirica]|uniref:TetM/TetW/TetO/TetS family tetracycline resistance ribosomal protection protein n=1 Tax=Mobilitalea sibirica TaxID=1462919 RepID=A0A8J7H574_9FIRM|nr:TetM/TetW/TetO/TetS family tetracycline resistance ribosomal protection protein [Mobilitalea sibirica]MBH1939946.1 TetM/TetW/TetO/TetS family tetracycline resistance ribosomal protection protein [Mobilitalea sibirica]